MFENKHIIVLLDPAEESAGAVSKAAQLAQLMKASLTIFATGFDSGLNALSSQSENARDNYLSKIREGLSPLTEIANNHDIEVTTEIVWAKHPSTALLNFIEGNPADLVIKATHHQNVIQRTFFNQTDWDLIRRSPTSLLLTKSAAWNDPPALIAAVDPVRTNDKPDFLDDHIIQTGLTLAEHLKTELQLLHVYDPTPLMIYLDQPAINATHIGEEIREQHLSALQSLAQGKGIGNERVHLEMGSPIQVIPDFLNERGTDLVVMGAADRSGLERWLLGHTAEKVLDRITVDILIAK